jgi:hypothetical protein
MATSEFDDHPPRPWFMHQRTYKALLERLNVYEAKCDLYESKLALRGRHDRPKSPASGLHFGRSDPVGPAVVD